MQLMYNGKSMLSCPQNESNSLKWQVGLDFFWVMRCDIKCAPFVHNLTLSKIPQENDWQELILFNLVFQFE